MTEQETGQTSVLATITQDGGKLTGNMVIGNQTYPVNGRNVNDFYSAILTRAIEVAKNTDQGVVTKITDHTKNLVETVNIDPDGGVSRESTEPLTVTPAPAPAHEPEPAPDPAPEPAQSPGQVFSQESREEPVVTIPPRPTHAAPMPKPGLDEYMATMPAEPAPEIPATPPTFDTASFGQRPRSSQGAVVAKEGFNGAMNSLTGGLLRLPAGRAEARRARQIEVLQNAAQATIAFMNTKGGGGKTTSLSCAAATIALHCAHVLLALDGNDNQGTLGDKGRRATHDATVRDMLTAVDDFTALHPGSTVPMSLIQQFLHQQPTGFFSLPSQSKAMKTKVLRAPELRRLHDLIAPSFSHVFIDTGNNIEGDDSTSTLQVAAEVSDRYVFSMLGKHDSAKNAFATMDYLTENGFGPKVRQSVAIISLTKTNSKEDLDEILEFLKGRVSTHVIIPWDAELDRGRDIRYDRLAPATRHAYLDAAVAILDPSSHQRRP